MEVRELSGFASSETSNMIGAPNSYGGGAGLMGHSIDIANSTTMRLQETSMFSSIPTLSETLGTIYTGDSGQGMKQGNMFNLVEPLKKRRGRPRKYEHDQNIALSLSHNSSISNHSKSLSAPAKRRGRPPGSRNKLHVNAFGSRGTAFIPHVITVKAGEDVASQIMAFSQKGSRTICILSANGAISNVTLRHTAISEGFTTYEDHFEIISLSGSYLPKDSEGDCDRTGGLNVVLAGPNGGVIAGEVRRLMAASAVQVVVGSFIVPNKKNLKRESPAPILGFHESSPATNSLPLQESLSESDEEERRSPATHNSGYHLQGGLTFN